jgi:hypothetical protein
MARDRGASPTGGNVNDGDLVWWIQVIGTAIGILFVPVGLLWHFRIRPEIELRWAAYRYRIQRNQRKADYIRWWRRQ